jgi:hypothetical protein
MKRRAMWSNVIRTQAMIFRTKEERPLFFSVVSI